MYLLFYVRPKTSTEGSHMTGRQYVRDPDDPIIEEVSTICMYDIKIHNNGICIGWPYIDVYTVSIVQSYKLLKIIAYFKYFVHSRNYY